MFWWVGWILLCRFMFYVSRNLARSFQPQLIDNKFNRILKFRHLTISFSISNSISSNLIYVVVQKIFCLHFYSMKSKNYKQWNCKITDVGGPEERKRFNLVMKKLDYSEYSYINDISHLSPFLSFFSCFLVANSNSRFYSRWSHFKCWDR